jgi:integrase
MLGCGLRVSEACGLCWSDWDEERGLLKIDRQMLILPGQDAILATLKTRSSRRTVTVPAFAAQALRERREGQKAEIAERVAKGLVWGNEWGLIFTGLGGKPTRAQGINASVNDSLIAAGMKSIGMHSLRHAFASVMIDSGMPITEVAHALGHATPAVTMQVYAHKLVGKPSQTAGVMDGLVSGKGSHLQPEK